MTLTPDQTQWFATTFGQLVGNVEQAVVGKTHQIQLAMASRSGLLAELEAQLARCGLAW